MVVSQFELERSSVDLSRENPAPANSPIAAPITIANGPMAGAKMIPTPAPKIIPPPEAIALTSPETSFLPITKFKLRHYPSDHRASVTSIRTERPA